jgi:Ca-activated chloride channel family protein
LRRLARLVLALLLAGLVVAAAPPASRPAAQAVDVDLVLALDLSSSISRGTLAFQLRGHAAAFRDPSVQNAIRSGPAGAVTVTLAAFGGPGSVSTLLPRRRIASVAEADAYADAIDALEVEAPGSATAIGSAMLALLPLFADAPADAALPPPRRVLDIVSNGFSNAGVDPAAARDVLAAAGVTVNALAILDEYDWLDGYFRERVIAGPGAFVRTVEGAEGFARALVAKLVREIV